MVYKLLLTLGTFVSLFVTGCVSTTQMGASAERKQLLLVPQSVLENSANARYEKYEQEAKAKHTYISNARLTEIMQTLIPHAESMMSKERKIHWKISANLNNYPNAVSVASGQIVVSTAFIIGPTFTDDELATLVAHEMAHIVRQHGREKASILNLGLFTAHNRSLELEADQLGLEIMARAGYNPDAAISFWEKTDLLLKRTEALLQKSGSSQKMPSLLVSHPQHEERMRQIQKHVLMMKALQQSLNIRNLSAPTTGLTVL